MVAISPVMALASSLASSLRRRSQAPMAWARRRTDRVRSRARGAGGQAGGLELGGSGGPAWPRPWPAGPSRSGSTTSASTTVVSARTLSVLITLFSAALASSASFRPATARSPQREVIFISVVGMRHRLVERDPAEPPPGDGVGHLAAQRLEAEAVAVLEEHHPQVGLDGDRRPADHRVEERPERLEEPLVVEQLVDLGQVAGQAQATLREDRLPQRRLRVYRSQHDGSNLLRNGRLEPS